MSKLQEAALPVITIVGASAVLGIAAFLFAYPEVGTKGWLLVATILVVWAIATCMVFRVRGRR